ncbi:hypothetical protein EPA99_14115 [Pseudoxanthomonas composti]|uniref:Uncharacterized protein n=1 Tax=Pseudoxanthomonas composti TaxID=2137479 RepID=A0A4Q1JT59_9GAMM|nr:hypothetical protein EPA99_14115 [Pseudoxanthomonas composti]
MIPAFQSENVVPVSHADLPDTHRNATRSSTLQLLDAGTTSRLSSPAPQPGTRWPWWLGFVLCAGLSWWIERRRAPHPPGRDAPSA